MRSAVNQASQAQGVAGTNAGAYNNTAGNISANLVPFATRQMENPTGYSQRDIGAQMTSALAGAGGATSGLTGASNKTAMTTRNPMGFSAALGQASRERDKAAAGTGEDIASQNAKVKLQQQQTGESTLAGLYGTAASTGAKWGDVQSEDIKDEVAANQTGWLQNLTGAASSAASGTGSAASIVALA